MPSNLSMSSHWHIYKCTVLSPDKPNKVYFGTAEGDFKKWFYNHRKSFDNEGSANDATLSKYIWELKETSNLSLTLVGSIAKKFRLILIYPRSVYCVFMKNSKQLIILDQRNYSTEDLN